MTGYVQAGIDYKESVDKGITVPQSLGLLTNLKAFDDIFSKFLIKLAPF